MTELEFLNILNSDQKLWANAAAKDNGDGTITKSITIPWGIGEVNIRMPFNDANAKRNAFGAFGANIRQIYADNRSDEAVSARVAKKAIQVEQDDSGSRDVQRPAGVQEQAPEEEVSSVTKESYKEDATQSPDLRVGLTARRVEVCGTRDRLAERVESDIAKLESFNKELKQIDRMLAVLEEDDNAPQDSGATKASS